MKRYKITLPTPEQCKASGIKFEGMEVRTRLWLMGVAPGIAFAPCLVRFRLTLAGRNGFTVECDTETVVDDVRAHLAQYDCTMIESA